MKSRFYLLASLTLISWFSPHCFAANTADSHKHQSDFSFAKPAEDDKKFKNYNFQEDLEKLCKNEDEDRNVFVYLSKHHPHKGKNTQQDDEKEDDINEVPIPAALWLFGSAFFGLTGLIRKKS